jgi:acyl-homoserine lactone acylase PvdQ
MDELEKHVIDAFSRGVNAYIQSDALYFKPIEFRLLGMDAPETWKPADSVCAYRIMSFMLASDASTRVLHSICSRDSEHGLGA